MSAAGAAGARRAAKRRQRKALGFSSAAASPRRIAVQEAREQAHKKLQRIFDEMDLDGNNLLTRDEVREALTKLDVNGEVPSEEDLTYVIRMADRDKTGTIDRGEMNVLGAVWKALQNDKSSIDKCFDSYDQNGSGVLEKDQVTAILTTLNGGMKPAEDEVDWVIEQADVQGNKALDRDELKTAITIWYGYVVHRPRKSLCWCCGAKKVHAASGP